MVLRREVKKDEKVVLGEVIRDNKSCRKAGRNASQVKAGFNILRIGSIEFWSESVLESGVPDLGWRVMFWGGEVLAVGVPMSG